MARELWRVIVVRAWREGRQVRARIIVQGDGQSSQVAASVTETVEVVRALLQGLESADQSPSSQMH